MEVRGRGSTDSSLGIPRRTLLRRGAIVGGALIWTPPVVITLASPASGAGTPMGGISFVAILVHHNGQLYRMKWDLNSGLSLTTGPTFDVSGGPNLLRYHPNVVSGPAPGTSALLNANGSVTVALGAGCTLADFVVKRGQCAARPGHAGQPAIERGGTVTFPVPTSDRASCS
jgi:hypothetical protein